MSVWPSVLLYVAQRLDAFELRRQGGHLCKIIHMTTARDRAGVLAKVQTQSPSVGDGRLSPLTQAKARSITVFKAETIFGAI